MTRISPVIITIVLVVFALFVPILIGLFVTGFDFERGQFPKIDEEIASDSGSVCTMIDKIVIDNRIIMRLVECEWGDGTKSKCVTASSGGVGVSCKISGDL